VMTDNRQQGYNTNEGGLDGTDGLRNRTSNGSHNTGRENVAYFQELIAGVTALIRNKVINIDDLPVSATTQIGDGFPGSIW
jgi:hypothetical protein